MPECPECSVEYEPEGSACPTCGLKHPPVVISVHEKASWLDAVLQAAGMALLSGPGAVAHLFLVQLVLGSVLFGPLWFRLGIVCLLYAGILFAVGAAIARVSTVGVFVGQVIGFGFLFLVMRQFAAEGFMGASSYEGDLRVATIKMALVLLFALPLLGTAIVKHASLCRYGRSGVRISLCIVCAVAAAFALHLLLSAAD